MGTMIPKIRPEVINASLISTVVFFGFTKRSSRVILRNLDVSSDINYAYEASATIFETLRANNETTIIDAINGIALKSLAGTLSNVEIRVEHKYLE